MAVYGPDNPQDLENLREASRLMEEARARQQEFGKAVRGKLFLGDDVLQDVATASDNSGLVRSLRTHETITGNESSLLLRL